MPSLSVVIVCKNEEDIIGRTLESVIGLTDDIIVYDNGSTDDTISIIRKYPVRLVQGPWEGFGKTKNKANSLAKYDWILSLDADEAVDEKLKQFLTGLHEVASHVVYRISFKNFLGSKYLRYGEWGGDSHIRLFNRQAIQWDDEPVHEKLLLPANVIIHDAKGSVHHRTMKDVADYAQKMVHYAMLNAEKYRRQGRRAGFLKIRVSPTFTFINYFLLKRGFLDGHTGYVCAKMTAWYTFLKYARLRELNIADKRALRKK